MYAVVKKSMNEIEIQAATNSYVFFFGIEETLKDLNWSTNEFYPKISFVILKLGSVFE
jgi:hypothetical protein